MATPTIDQVSQDFCRIPVMSDEGGNTQCGSKLKSESTYVDASVICHKPVNLETSDPFPPCVVTVDIDKGAAVADVSNIGEEICGSIKTEISLPKLLRRQNSLQTGGESIPPLMDHILMLLKFDAKEKQATEKVQDATNNRWRKCKRAGLFDSRQIVLLFSILSSMGTIVLIFLTLRVRQLSEGYVHG